MPPRILTGAAASLVVFAWAGAAGAGDTFRLTGTDAPTVTLGLQGGADTVPVGWHGGHGYRRGYYGHSGFYRRSYYRPFSFGFYPGFYRSDYYPRYYSFGFSIGRPYSYYYPSVYSAPAYYTPSYSAPYYNYCPTTNDAGGSLSTTFLRPRNRTYVLQPPREQLPPPRKVPGDGTYPYDGGPMNPVPMPGIQPDPAKKPPAKRQMEGRVASLMPVKMSKFAYPAYGEQPAPTSFAVDRTVPLKSQISLRDPR